MSRQTCRLLPLVLTLLSVACDASSGKKAPASTTMTAQPVNAASPTTTPTKRSPVQPSKSSASGSGLTLGQGTCEKMCSATRALHCGSVSACLSGCEEMASQGFCSQEMQAFIGCAVSLPVADWECGGDGVATVKDGRCSMEQSAFMQCVRSEALKQGAAL